VSAGVAGEGTVKQKQQGADRPTEAPGKGGEELGRRKSIPLVEGHPESSGPRTHPEGKRLPSTGVGMNKGTGEKYVKSTGLVAEGGDFDASRPGAGREADRLLGKDSDKPAEEAAAGTGGGATHDKHGDGEKHGGEKPSLGEKIKEKLHIGSHHH